MLVAFASCSQNASFQILRANNTFVLFMTAGSLVRTILSGPPLGVVPNVVPSRCPFC